MLHNSGREVITMDVEFTVHTIREEALTAAQREALDRVKQLLREKELAKWKSSLSRSTTDWSSIAVK